MSPPYLQIGKVIMRTVAQFEIHDTLNPKIWSSDNILLPEVRTHIIDIVKQFVDSSDISFNIIDIRIVGSQASYNYTSYSDLDIHIITNFEYFECSPELIQILFNSLKSKFNNEYTITIRDIDVELYIEDINSTAVSNGIYSVLQDRWVKVPHKLSEVPEIDISAQLNKWIPLINSALSSNDAQKVESLLNNIYIIRADALASKGEYSAGNYLFKEIRNRGLLNKLKAHYKKIRSTELTLERLQLNEDSRANLLSKSKKSAKGFQRFQKRVKSRVANRVKQYNLIDMNKLFKQDILTVDVEVKGETDNYVVKIRFGGFLELLHDQIDRTGEFNLKAVTRALINGFNKDDVYIHCSCPDWQYRFAYYATKNNITSGDPENRPSDITNPDDKLGVGCKHVLLVLSNTSWILKVASTIYNYVNYMEKHYNRLYAKIIYPAIYREEYKEPEQLDIFDDDNLDSETSTIDKSNDEARKRNVFQKNNTYGVRFAPQSKDKAAQLSIDDPQEN